MRPIRLLFLACAAVCLAACTKGFTSREIAPGDTASIAVLFDHGVHRKAFQRMELNCLSCHPEKKALEGVTPARGTGRRFVCHDCHRNVTLAGEVPQRCAICHGDLRPHLPADHRLDWGTRHAIFAKTDPARCASCHDNSSCADCHLKRDTIRQAAHPRTYRYYHSIEGRANPHKCGSCHQIHFCRDCHLQTGVAF